MIKKFEQYNEMDPYNEEEWGTEDDLKIGDMLYATEKGRFEGANPNEFYGRIVGFDERDNIEFEKKSFFHTNKNARWKRYRGHIKQYIELGYLKVVPYVTIE